MVTTFVGGPQGMVNGVGTNARFSNPRSLDMAANGNLLVVDYSNNRIRIVDPTGGTRASHVQPESSALEHICQG